MALLRLPALRPEATSPSRACPTARRPLTIVRGFYGSRSRIVARLSKSSFPACFNGAAADQPRKANPAARLARAEEQSSASFQSAALTGHHVGWVRMYTLCLERKDHGWWW
jgi:hypothetical protein